MQPNPLEESKKTIDKAKEEVAPPPESIEEAADSIQGQIRESFEAFVDRLPLIVASIATLVLTWIVARLFQAGFERLLKLTPLSESKQVLLSRTITILLWGFGGLLAVVVGFPGLSTSRAFAVLALSSVAFGFAFRDLAENLFAGMILLSQFPFGKGDFVKSASCSGTVEEITLRMTKLRTIAGELVVVPNAVLYRGEISILTESDKMRATVDVDVAYGTEVTEAISAIEDAISECESVVEDPAPEAMAWSLGDNGITLRVAWWTSPRPLEIRRSRSEVISAIYHALNEAGITIPFPQRTVSITRQDESLQ